MSRKRSPCLLARFLKHGRLDKVVPGVCMLKNIHHSTDSCNIFIPERERLVSIHDYTKNFVELCRLIFHRRATVGNAIRNGKIIDLV